MTASAISPARRSGFALRFSLRVLLIAFTAFAIGFPVWYRWPYTEEEPLYYVRNGKPAKSLPTKGRIVATWQRQWGGGRAKHGPEWVYADGKLKSLSHYLRGQLDGPHERYNLRGAFQETGQHSAGQRTGIWSLFDARGQVVLTETWQNGVLDGPCEMMRPIGPPVRFLYEAGRILSVDGRRVSDRLHELVQQHRIDSPRIAKELVAPTDLEFVETPLGEAVSYLREKHEVPIVLDPRHADSKPPLTCQLKGIPLATALEVIVAQANHACDYRYGCLWITSAEDAQDWRDPSGVTEIEPPKDSQLARSWDEPVVVRAIDQPMAAVLAKMAQPLAIEIDTRALDSSADGKTDYPVTWNSTGQPFRHVLGLLLYQTRCRCELRGETLVILPPESP
jgi:hypothetical protein